MKRQPTTDLHRALSLAGFRSLATAAGLLQLCRELEGAGVIGSDANVRVRQAMFDELKEQAPWSVTKDPAFAGRLQDRLEKLFAGTERLSDETVLAPR